MNKNDDNKMVYSANKEEEEMMMRFVRITSSIVLHSVF